MDIDWSKAPEGATHYLPKTDKYFACWVKPGFFMREDSQTGWVEDDDDSAAHLYFARHETWNGEGLPPVGTDLEGGFACEEFEIWHKGTCVAVGEDPEGREEFCVVQFGKVIAMCTTEGQLMRPIRNAEQIAAEERKSAIEDILLVMTGHRDLKAWADTSYETMAGIIYDAGYRKVEAAQ